MDGFRRKYPNLSDTCKRSSHENWRWTCPRTKGYLHWAAMKLSFKELRRWVTQKGLARWLAIVLFVYILNFVLLGFLIGPFDYDHLSTYYELAWRFWQTGGGLFPHFNPYLCGGRTLGADPQIPIYHPLVFLVPVLGPTLLIKFEMLAQLALGLYGLDRLLRHFHCDEEQRLWGLLLFASGGAVVARFMVGHVTMGFFFFLPLFLWMSYRFSSWHQVRTSFFAAYCFLFIYSGLYKPNFIIYCVPLLLAEVAVRSLVQRNIRPLAVFLFALALSMGANAPTYLPAWSYFREFPRLSGSEPQLIAFYSWIANALLPLKAIPKAFYGGGFSLPHEYNLFVGPAALVFAFRSFRERDRIDGSEMAGLLTLLVASFWIGLGSPSHSFSIFYPYSWLWNGWPGFQSVRVPPRFWFGSSVVLIILSSIGFRYPVTARMRRVFLLWGPILLVAHAAINLSKTTVLATTTQFSIPRAFPSRIVLTHTNPDFPYAYVRLGKAVIECVENIETHRTPDLVEADTLQLTSPSNVSGSADWDGWNRISIQAHAHTPFTVALNLNHAPYWKLHASSGEIISRFGEPLTLRSEDGELTGLLVFEQPWVREAVTLSLMVWALFLLFLPVPSLTRCQKSPLPRGSDPL